MDNKKCGGEPPKRFEKEETDMEKAKRTNKETACGESRRHGREHSPEESAARSVLSENDPEIADVHEVLAALSRIVRREETEDVPVKLRTETRSVDADGEPVVERSERVEMQAARPRLSDVNRSAELLGKYYGVFRDRVEGSIALPVMICGEEDLQ